MRRLQQKGRQIQELVLEEQVATTTRVRVDKDKGEAVKAKETEGVQEEEQELAQEGVLHLDQAHQELDLEHLDQEEVHLEELVDTKVQLVQSHLQEDLLLAEVAKAGHEEDLLVDPEAIPQEHPEEAHQVVPEVDQQDQEGVVQVLEDEVDLETHSPVILHLEVLMLGHSEGTPREDLLEEILKEDLLEGAPKETMREARDLSEVLMVLMTLVLLQLILAMALPPMEEMALKGQEVSLLLELTQGTHVSLN